MYRVSVSASCALASRTTGRRITPTPTTRRWLSDNKTTTTSTSTSSSSTKTTTAASKAPQTTSGPMEFRNAAERHEYLKAANAEMERYHHAREMLRRGTLKSKQQEQSGGATTTSEANKLSTGVAQLAVVSLFLMAFMASPFLGKKIATDEEFRNTYVPSWYDFTVPKPEKPWTREELHEQMVAVQREIRERAIRGDFAPEKLDELQKNFELQQQQQQALNPGQKKNKNNPKSPIRKEWERIHPGLEEGEEVNES